MEKDRKRVRLGGLLPFDVEEVVGRTRFTGFSGLPLVAEALRASGAGRAIQEGAQSRVRRRGRGLTDVELVESFCVMLAGGGEHFDDFERFRSDEGLAELLGHEFPSPTRAKEYLYAFEDEESSGVCAGSRGRLFAAGGVAEESGLLESLGGAVCATVRAAQRQEPSREATLDIDATIMGSSKREAKMTYEGERGYQPVVVWAEKDMVVADEFRDGNVPAGTGLLRVVQRAVEALPEGVEKVYLRSDSAGYTHDLMNGCREEANITFAISADMSRELRSVIEALGPEAWTVLESKGDRVRSWAEVGFVPSDPAAKKGRRPDRYLAIRIRPTQGKLFGDGSEVKYYAVVTNDWDRDGSAILAWQRQKAGTIEQTHDVLKNGLGAGVLPCGRFGANAAWLRLNVLTYNLLSLVRNAGAGEELARARPKRLRLLLLCVAGQVVHHARSVVCRVMRGTHRHLGMLCRIRAALVRLGVATAVAPPGWPPEARAAPGEA